MASKEDVAWSVVVGVETAHFYSAFLPSIFTIEKFAKDGETDRAALRRGEFFATTFAFLLGWAASELTDSELPLIATIIVAAMMLVVYEMGIRGTLNRLPIPVIGAAVAIPFVPPPP